MDQKSTMHMLWIAAHLDLNKLEYQVLLFLLPKLLRGGYVRLNGVALSEELNTSRSQVSKAIKKLIVVGILDSEGAQSRKVKLVEHDFNAVVNSVEGDDAQSIADSLLLSAERIRKCKKEDE